MSCYNWERGTIKIPAAAWYPLKKQLRTAWAEHLKRRYELAQELYRHLKEAAKGKRKFDYREAAYTWAESKRPSNWRFPLERPFDEAEDRYAGALSVIRFVLPCDSGKKCKPRAPKKKDFAVPARLLCIGNHPASEWMGCIEFVEKDRHLLWDVRKNNHAVEYAWAHPMGQAVEKALSDIQWTCGSGGYFVGNDEYNDDRETPGGGGNYITRRFGPLGARA